MERLQVADTLGAPPRPVDPVDLSTLKLPVVDYDPLTNKVPTPEEEGVYMELPEQKKRVSWNT